MRLKECIISDLHKLLFTIDFECDPDNFELNIALARALLRHNHLFFKEKQQVPDSVYWGSDKNDVEQYFFTTICPGIVPTVLQFMSVCDAFIDWKMWEILHATFHDAADISAAVKRLKKAMTQATQNPKRTGQKSPTPPDHNKDIKRNTKTQTLPLTTTNDDLKPAA